MLTQHRRTEEENVRFRPLLVTLVAAGLLVLALAASSLGRGEQPRCAGKVATITGSHGNDEIAGTPRRDVIVAGGGNDGVKSMGGRDYVCGGNGFDDLRGGRGRDVLRGERSTDTLVGRRGNDRLFGGREQDALNGSSGDDLCKGGPPNEETHPFPDRIPDLAHRCERIKGAINADA
jgi:hypothetical protein